MPIVIKCRGDFEWDVVEEKGVHERVLETLPTEAMAIARVQAINARRAQAAMGTAGTYTMGGDGARPKGCTCPRGGMQLEAIECPVHDV
jgi:hypothetical protein